jgi:predicted amidophosphoribosyltransferase
MAAMVRRLLAALGGVLAIHVVTWAPTSVERRRRRGFDQAELLARGVAHALVLPCRPLLRRGPGPPQTGRGRDERWRGPSFEAIAPARSSGTRLPGTVLLVDDLLTTGATLTSAAQALRAGGASTVIAVTAGRTPLKVGPRPADP